MRNNEEACDYCHAKNVKLYNSYIEDYEVICEKCYIEEIEREKKLLTSIYTKKIAYLNSLLIFE